MTSEQNFKKLTFTIYDFYNKTKNGEIPFFREKNGTVRFSDTKNKKNKDVIVYKPFKIEQEDRLDKINRLSQLSDVKNDKVYTNRNPVETYKYRMEKLDGMLNENIWYVVHSDDYKYLQKPYFFDLDTTRKQESEKAEEKAEERGELEEKADEMEKSEEKADEMEKSDDYEEIIIDKDDLIRACKLFSNESLDEGVIRKIEKRLKLPVGILDEYKLVLYGILSDLSKKVSVPKKAPEKTRKCTKRNPPPDATTGNCPKDIPYLRESCCYKTRKASILGMKKDIKKPISWGHEIDSDGDKHDISKAVSDEDYTAMGFENILFPK